jgi:Tol biopolymer transport system component
LSGNGQTIAFHSSADDLISTDNNGMSDVFVFDTNLQTNSIINPTANGDSRLLGISPDGRFLCLRSSATNLTTGGGVGTIFVHDSLAHTNVTIDVTDDGSQPDHIASDCAVNSGGRFVVFESRANNILPNDNNGFRSDVFLRDVIGGITTRLSVQENGEVADGQSLQVSISGNGHYVVFRSNANNIIPNDFNSLGETVVIDLQLGRAASASDGGVGQHPQISTDGRFIVYDDNEYVYRAPNPLFPWE